MYLLNDYMWHLLHVHAVSLLIGTSWHVQCNDQQATPFRIHRALSSSRHYISGPSKILHQLFVHSNTESRRCPPCKEGSVQVYVSCNPQTLLLHHIQLLKSRTGDHIKIQYKMYTPVTCTVPFTHQWHKLLATTNIAYIHMYNVYLPLKSATASV